MWPFNKKSKRVIAIAAMAAAISLLGNRIQATHPQDYDQPSGPVITQRETDYSKGFRNLNDELLKSNQALNTGNKQEALVHLAKAKQTWVNLTGRPNLPKPTQEYLDNIGKLIIESEKNTKQM